MEIQEIKIDGVVYVPSDSCECRHCEMRNIQSCLIHKECSKPILICSLFDGHALKVKED